MFGVFLAVVLGIGNDDVGTSDEFLKFQILLASEVGVLLGLMGGSGALETAEKFVVGKVGDGASLGEQLITYANSGMIHESGFDGDLPEIEIEGF